MTKEELYTKVENLLYWDNSVGYMLDKDYIIWEEYAYIIVGNVIFITLENKEDAIMFRRLSQDWWTKVPMVNLDLQSALELLFVHYPYWYTNSSNSYLINNDGYILWAIYNGMKHNANIVVDWVKEKEFVQLKNWTKIDGKFKWADVDKLNKLIIW